MPGHIYARPVATPEAQRKALSAAFAKVNQDPAYRKKMIDAGYVIVDVDYEKAPAFLAAKRKEYEVAARAVGLLK